MANIFDVAKYILSSIGDEISTMKLQKLCYYSQAWNLVWENEALFEEDFWRWENGPVCKELFNIHQGKFCISANQIPDYKCSGADLSIENIRNIDQIIEDYGKFNGAELSEMTHKEAPWLNTPKNCIIEKPVIKSYYTMLANSNKGF